MYKNKEIPLYQNFLNEDEELKKGKIENPDKEQEMVITDIKPNYAARVAIFVFQTLLPGFGLLIKV